MPDSKASLQADRLIELNTRQNMCGYSVRTFINSDVVDKVDDGDLVGILNMLYVLSEFGGDFGESIDFIYPMVRNDEISEIRISAIMGPGEERRLIIGEEGFQVY